MHTPKNIAIALLLAVAFCAGCTTSSYKTVEPQEFAQLITNTDSIQIVDVRSVDEYASGHIAQSVLIDIQSGQFTAEASKHLSTQLPVAVYCRSGRRSAMAADSLTALGFTVVNLNGGIIAWQQHNLPTVNE